MRRRQRTLAELLTRSLAVSGLLYALVIVYAVPATLLADAPTAEGRDRGSGWLSRLDDHPTWRPAHAERFPGCVDMALWDGPEVPGDVVVVGRDGEATRMSFDEAFQRATGSSGTDDVWTIGACR